MVSEWVAFLKKMLRTLTEVPMKAQIIDPNYNGTTSKINSEGNHLPLYSHQYFPAQCQDGWEISEVCLLTVLIQSLYLKYAQFCFPEQQLMCTVYQWTLEKVKLCWPSEMRALPITDTHSWGRKTERKSPVQSHTECCCFKFPLLFCTDCQNHCTHSGYILFIFLPPISYYLHALNANLE